MRRLALLGLVLALSSCQVAFLATGAVMSGCGPRGCNQGDPYDHPAGQHENPPRAVAKRGPPFFCTLDPSRPTLGACSSTREGCDDYRRSLERQGVATRACREQGAAACFAAVRIADATRIERCFPSVNGCRAQRAIKAGNPAYTEVSTCIDVP
jgi:hypothetical protein